MNEILRTFASPGWTHLIHALLHSLWLGTIWAVLLAGGLRMAGRNANARYSLSLTALACLLASTLIAWAAERTDWSGSGPEPAVRGTNLPIVGALENPAVAGPRAETVSGGTGSARANLGAAASASEESAAGPVWIGMAALVWLAGLGLMLVRLAGQLIEMRQTSEGRRPIPDPEPMRMLAELKSMLGIQRAVELASSAAVRVPCVLGAFAPAILLPASMVTGLPAEQMRAILAHELAHIQRHDFLINIFQQVIEALLFFNPAVWWINRQIRLEREACCDALAVSVLPERGVYAKALVDVVEHVGLDSESAASLPAFPGDRPRSSLLERIHRLLAPDYQPLVRLPWPSFLVVIAASGLCLAGMWRGSQFAVAIAAEILTAEQRMERIAALRTETGLIDEDRAYTTEDRIMISGRVRTADGFQPERWPMLKAMVIRESHRFGISIPAASNGTFDSRIEFGRVYLRAGLEGYAPAFVGPLETAPGGSIGPIDIVLEKGFPATIRLRSPDRKPLAGVELEGSFEHPAASEPLRLKTDEKGDAVVAHAISHPMKWKVSADGFQIDERTGVILHPDQPMEWMLRPARPTAGLVIARETKQPIEGAEIKLLHRGPKLEVTHPDRRSAPVLGRTDKRGTFVLTSLPDDARHVLLVEATGHAPKIVQGVFAGVQIPVVELGPEIVIEGEIHGDLSQLQASPDPVVFVDNPLTVGNHSHSRREPVPVRIEDGVGYFTARDLLEGEVRIMAGQSFFTFTVGESRADRVIRIQLNPPPAAGQEATRTVAIRFRVPDGAPDVRGVLNARTWTDTAGFNENQPLVITNNEARIEAPTPGWLSYETSGLIGYWIPEQHALRVDRATEDLVLEVPAIPAGAIHGSVRDADGSETGGVLVLVVETRKSPEKRTPGLLGQIGKLSASPDDGPTRFVAQPLPLGGEYMLVAHRGNQYVASEPIVLTAESPIREVDLRLVPGRDLAISILDEAGNPLPLIRAELTYSTPFSHAFTFGGDLITDRTGRLLLEGLNSDIPGECHLTVKGQSGYQPARVRIDFARQPVGVTLKPGLRITGVVVDENTGKPVAGAEVYARPVTARTGEPFAFLDADSKTDANGRFIFSTLADREYRIASRAGQSEDVRARPGQHDPVTLRIKPYPWVRQQ